jgi:type I restriction enzyme S subunit
MWFSREEFDREAAYYAVGGVRGNLPWDDFFEMQIPIPPISRQRELVAQYNTIQNRIDQNNQLIAKLEETAQAIYKEWFVDGVDRRNLIKLSEIVEGNPETISKNDEFSSILYLDTSNITNNKIDEVQELDLELDEIPSRAKRKVKNNDIIFSTVRPALKHFGILKNPPENLIVSTGFAVLRLKNDFLFPELIYSFLTDNKILEELQAKAEMSVSTYPSITINDILNLDFTLPDEDVLNETRQFFKTKNDLINLKNKESQKLEQLKGLLLSRMARDESNRVFTGRNTNIETI